MRDARAVRTKPGPLWVPLLLALTLLALPAVLLAPSVASSESIAATQQYADEWLAQPVDDETFRTFLDFFVYDHSVPFDAEVLDVEETEGIRNEHLAFQSTAGITVYARLFSAVASPVEGAPAVILLHGGGAGAKDGPGVALYAGLMARAGWAVLAIDLQHWGERSTDLLQSFREAEKHERLYNQPPVYLAWTTQTVKDVGRSYDFLVEERGVDPARVVLVGSSRGALVGTVAGGADRRLAGVALLVGGHFDALETGHLAAACPANYIGRISPRPLLMINGNRDTDLIRETSVLPVQRLAGSPSQFLWTDTGHGATPLTEEAQTTLLTWLREAIPSR